MRAAKNTCLIGLFVGVAALSFSFKATSQEPIDDPAVLIPDSASIPKLSADLDSLSPWERERLDFEVASSKPKPALLTPEEKVEAFLRSLEEEGMG